MKRATRAWDSEIRQRWLRSWTDRHGPVEEAEPAPAARRIGNRFLLLISPRTGSISRGLRRTPVDSTAADKRLHSNVLNRKLRIVSHLPKHARTGSTPAASKVACDSAPAAEQAARQRKYRSVLRGGSALLCLCPPATRTRRCPTRDHRSVTTAGVTMVPRSADQRVVVSAVHDLTPSTEGLQRPRTSEVLFGQVRGGRSWPLRVV